MHGLSTEFVRAVLMTPSSEFCPPLCADGKGHVKKMIDSKHSTPQPNPQHLESSMQRRVHSSPRTEDAPAGLRAHSGRAPPICRGVWACRFSCALVTAANALGQKGFRAIARGSNFFQTTSCMLGGGRGSGGGVAQAVAEAGCRYPL